MEGGGEQVNQEVDALEFLENFQGDLWRGGEGVFRGMIQGIPQSLVAEGQVKEGEDNQEALQNQNALYQTVRRIGSFTERNQSALNQIFFEFQKNMAANYRVRDIRRFESIPDQQFREKVKGYQYSTGIMSSPIAYQRYQVARFLTPLIKYQQFGSTGKFKYQQDLIDKEILDIDKYQIEEEKKKQQKERLKRLNNKRIEILEKVPGEAIIAMKNLEVQLQPLISFYKQSEDFIQKDISAVSQFEYKKDIDSINQFTIKDIAAFGHSEEIYSALKGVTKVEPKHFEAIVRAGEQFEEHFLKEFQAIQDENRRQSSNLRYIQGGKIRDFTRKQIDRRIFQEGLENTIDGISFNELLDKIRFDDTYVPPKILRNFPEYMEFYRETKAFYGGEQGIQQAIDFSRKSTKTLYWIKHGGFRSLNPNDFWHQMESQSDRVQTTQQIEDVIEEGIGRDSPLYKPYKQLLNEARSSGEQYIINTLLYNIAISTDTNLERISKMGADFNEAMQTLKNRESWANERLKWTNFERAAFSQPDNQMYLDFREVLQRDMQEAERIYNKHYKQLHDRGGPEVVLEEDYQNTVNVVKFARDMLSGYYDYYKQGRYKERVLPIANQQPVPQIEKPIQKSRKRSQSPLPTTRLEEEVSPRTVNIQNVQKQIVQQVEENVQSLEQQVEEQKHTKKTLEKARRSAKKHGMFSNDKLEEIKETAEEMDIQLREDLVEATQQLNQVTSQVAQIQPVQIQPIKVPSAVLEPEKYLNQTIKPHLLKLKGVVFDKIQQEERIDQQAQQNEEMQGVPEPVVLAQEEEKKQSELDQLGEQDQIMRDANQQESKNLVKYQENFTKEQLKILDAVDKRITQTLQNYGATQKKEYKLQLDALIRERNLQEKMIEGFESISQSFVGDLYKKSQKVVQDFSEELRNQGAKEMEGVTTARTTFDNFVKQFSLGTMMTRKELLEQFGRDYQQLSFDYNSFHQELKQYKPSPNQYGVQTAQQIKIFGAIDNVIEKIRSNVRVYRDYFRSYYESISTDLEGGEKMTSRPFEQQQILKAKDRLQEYRDIMDQINIITSQTIGPDLIIQKINPNRQYDEFNDLIQNVRLLQDQHKDLTGEYRQSGIIKKEKMQDYWKNFSKVAAKFAGQFSQFSHEQDDLYRTIMKQQAVQLDEAIEKGLATPAVQTGLDEKFLNELKQEFLSQNGQEAFRQIGLTDSEVNEVYQHMVAKYGEQNISKDLIKRFMLVQHFNASKQQILGKLFARFLQLSPSFENSETVGHILYDPNRHDITAKEMETLLNKDVFRNLMYNVLSNEQAAFLEKISKIKQTDENALEDGMKNIVRPFIDSLSDAMIRQYDVLIQKNLRDARKYITTEDFVMMALSRDQTELEAHARSWVNFTYDPSKLGSKGLLPKESREYRKRYETIYEAMQQIRQDAEAEKQEESEFEIGNLRNYLRPERFLGGDSIFKIPKRDQYKGALREGEEQNEKAKQPKSMSLYSYAEAIKTGPSIEFFQKVVPQRRQKAQAEIEEFEQLQDIQAIGPNREQVQKFANLFERQSYTQSIDSIIQLYSEIMTTIDYAIEQGRAVPAPAMQYYTSLQEATRGLYEAIKTSGDVGGQKHLLFLENLMEQQQEYFQQVVDTEQKQYQEALQYFDELQVKDYSTYLNLTQQEQQMKQKAQALFDIELQKLTLPKQEPQLPQSGSFGAGPITTGQFLASQKGLGGGLFQSRGGFYQGLRNKSKVFGQSFGAQTGLQGVQTYQTPATAQVNVTTSDLSFKGTLPSKFNEQQKKLITHVEYSNKLNKLVYKDNDDKIRELTSEERQFLAQTYADLFFYLFEHFVSAMIQAKKQKLQSDLHTVIQGSGPEQYDLLRIINKASNLVQSHNVTEEQLNKMVDKIHSLATKPAKEEKKQEKEEAKQEKEIKKSDQQQAQQ